MAVDIKVERKPPARTCGFCASTQLEEIEKGKWQCRKCQRVGTFSVTKRGGLSWKETPQSKYQRDQQDGDYDPKTGKDIEGRR